MNIDSQISSTQLLDIDISINYVDMMELRDLAYFEVIARHGNLGRAAAALDVGQPALSMSLRRLERSAQAKLVKRTPKGVELTSVGAALLSHVRRLRLARDDLAREVGDLAQGRTGQLRIGTGPALAETFLPVCYSALLQQAPKVSLTTTLSGTAPLLDALRNGDLDMVINHTPHPFASDLVQEWLWDDEFVVYSSVEHRLAKRKAVSLPELVNERWALTAASALTSRQLSRAFEDRGLDLPEIQVMSDSVMLRLRTVATSGLLGFSSRRVVECAAPYARVRVVPVRDMKWIRPVAAFYRKDGYLSPASKRLLEILKATAKEFATKKG